MSKRVVRQQQQQQKHRSQNVTKQKTKVTIIRLIKNNKLKKKM